MRLEAIVVVISHKALPDANEQRSLQSCWRHLSRYPFEFLLPEEIDDSYYRTAFPGATIGRVPQLLLSWRGYNYLKISPHFYERYSEYRYLLTVEPDVFVFRDDLKVWCRKGFDYVGAPWFTSTRTEGVPKLVSVGNSGFSLRKVTTFRRWFLVQERIEFLRNRIRRIGLTKTVFTPKENLDGLRECTGNPEVVRSLIAERRDVQEDGFWCGNTWEEYKDGLRDLSIVFLFYLPWLWWFLRRPSPRQASRFSFEVHPSYLYRLNGNRLPFGCHAWEKWEPEFWREHIR